MNALSPRQSFHTEFRKPSVLGRQKVTVSKVKNSMTDLSQSDSVKDDDAFTIQSRKEDAELLRQAWPGFSNNHIAEQAHEYLGWSEREIVRWLSLKHDMPSRVVKAIEKYLHAVESVASRIEGK